MHRVMSSMLVFATAMWCTTAKASEENVGEKGKKNTASEHGQVLGNASDTSSNSLL